MCCETCRPRGGRVDQVAPDESEVTEPAHEIAGGSALAEYERRTRRRDASVRAKHPRLGGLILAVTEEPGSTAAWAKGARGERYVGFYFDRLRSTGAAVLHDRRIPRTRANIDHIVVADSGVWIIDTKHYGGRIQRRDTGGWFRSDIRLFVGRRDRTNLVVAMAKQVDAVRAALGCDNVLIRPVLCFVDAERTAFAKPFRLGGVLVTSPRRLRRSIQHGADQGLDVSEIAARLSARLPPATHVARGEQV